MTQSIEKLQALINQKLRDKGVEEACTALKSEIALLINDGLDGTCPLNEIIKMINDTQTELTNARGVAHEQRG